MQRKGMASVAMAVMLGIGGQFVNPAGITSPQTSTLGMQSAEAFGLGNLGGASIPMLMSYNLCDELQHRSLTLLCSSFGLGLTWGTMLLKTRPMRVLPVNHI